jgi:hypothetical protein
MRTIKEVVSNIDPNSKIFTDLEVRCVSIKRFYKELKQQGRIRDIVRLKCLFHYYPETMLEKIPLSHIKSCVDRPDTVRMMVSNDRDWFFSFEKYAIEKMNGKGTTSRNFYLKDMYEYFGI